MLTANGITGDLLLSPLRLLVSCRKIVECVTAVLLPVRISQISLQNAGRKNSLKKRKTAVASKVSPIDPNEQLQAEMQSLGYVEVLFIYTIIHANKLLSQAYSSISEFSCFAGLMEIFSLTTWRPALSAICGEGKGLKELDISVIVPGLMRYALMQFRQEFFAILIENFLLLFLRTSFLLSFQPWTLFFLIFLHTRYAK